MESMPHEWLHTGQSMACNAPRWNLIARSIDLRQVQPDNLCVIHERGAVEGVEHELSIVVHVGSAVGPARRRRQEPMAAEVARGPTQPGLDLDVQRAFLEAPARRDPRLADAVLGELGRAWREDAPVA